jgi:hypothetical protein
MGKYIDKLKSSINKNGKGDKNRVTNKAKFDNNWDNILWKSKTKYDKLLNKIVKKG